ncbi:MAG: hypothetical protein IPQ07_25175 [Myxococcales bacterium]|nr:hypothetical protein [Myxococcales bacterium]
MRHDQVLHPSDLPDTRASSTARLFEACCASWLSGGGGVIDEHAVTLEVAEDSADLRTQGEVPRSITACGAVAAPPAADPARPLGRGAGSPCLSAQLIELTGARGTDLDARLEIATDPFFVSDAASARTYQAMRSTKLELKLGIDATTTTAATSFNLHGTHFTSRMAIGDGVTETACIGFGLERWMAAIVARWGGSPAI